MYTAGYGVQQASSLAFDDRQWGFENIFAAKLSRLSQLQGLHAVEQCVALVRTAAEFNPAPLSPPSSYKAWGTGGNSVLAGMSGPCWQDSPDL